MERMKHAEHCGFSSKPTLNQTGELNDASWLTRIDFSSASNVSASSSSAKYSPARPQPPIVDDDAADHLAHAPLALGGTEAAAEVLLGDDVGGRLRPELRELDALLLEGRLVLAGDEGVAHLPLDLLERVAARDREVAANAGVTLGVEHRILEQCVGDLVCLHGRHIVPPGHRVSPMLFPRGREGSQAERGDHRRASVGRKTGSLTRRREDRQ